MKLPTKRSSRKMWADYVIAHPRELFNVPVGRLTQEAVLEVINLDLDFVAENYTAAWNHQHFESSPVVPNILANKNKFAYDVLSSCSLHVVY